MRRINVLAVMAAFALTGCYHAVVDTGRTPSAQTIEKQWAHGWVFGLVPPSTLETAQKCSSGVAKVETQLSFANQLVGFLTSYLYTPMEVKVTCAEAGTSALPTIKSGADRLGALEDAARLSQTAGGPVQIKF